MGLFFYPTANRKIYKMIEETLHKTAQRRFHQSTQDKEYKICGLAKQHIISLSKGKKYHRHGRLHQRLTFRDKNQPTNTSKIGSKNMATKKLKKRDVLGHLTPNLFKEN
jgi:hypothetical protein